jgi:predicted PurR-regulated permease PerM
MAKRGQRLAVPRLAHAAWDRFRATRPGGGADGVGGQTSGAEARRDPRRAASVEDLGLKHYTRLTLASEGVAPSAPREHMPRWLPRAYFVAMLTVSAFFVAWWLLGRLRDLIGLLLLAQFLAFALEPAVNWLARRGWKRGAATGVSMLVVLLALVGFMVAVGSLLVSQVSTLSTNFPTYLRGAVEWFDSTFHASISIDQIQDQITNNDTFKKWATGIATNAVSLSTSVFGVIFQTLTVLLFSYYLCADAPRVRRSICSVLPPARQREVMRAWEISVDKTGGYIYSRLVLALVSALAHYIVLTLLGIQYSVALALWIGLVSQLIPTVGTYLAASLPLIVAVVGDPVDALYLLIFVIIYQQVENYLLQPRITARTLDLHPALAFGAVLAGAAILGATGAVLAIPLTAIVQTFVGSYIRRYEVEDHPFHDEPGAPARLPIEPTPVPPRNGDAAPHDTDGSVAAPAPPAADAPVSKESKAEAAPGEGGQ